MFHQTRSNRQRGGWVPRTDRNRRCSPAVLSRFLRDRIPTSNVIVELARQEFNETFLSEIQQEGGE
jgi:hypothetical protein